MICSYDNKYRELMGDLFSRELKNFVSGIPVVLFWYDRKEKKAGKRLLVFPAKLKRFLFCSRALSTFASARCRATMLTRAPQKDLVRNSSSKIRNSGAVTSVEVLLGGARAFLPLASIGYGFAIRAIVPTNWRVSETWSRRNISPAFLADAVAFLLLTKIGYVVADPNIAPQNCRVLAPWIGGKISPTRAILYSSSACSLRSISPLIQSPVWDDFLGGAGANQLLAILDYFPIEP
uniref:Uncharacterized protein n=1 Tax=Romanomermis culicivorax TaxID=13658 RepID=A0A915HTQ7_ROMCU